MISPETAEAIVILLIGTMIIEGFWLIMLTHMMYKKQKEKAKEVAMAVQVQAEVEKNTIIEDVFLLHRSGLMLKHYTRRLRPNLDSDVLSGMLVAVQEFIKDSFRGEKGMLKEIRFGELRIIVLEGQWTIVSCLVRGERVMDMQPQLAAALADIENKYADLLMNWDGTMDAAPEVDKIMQRLLDGGYKGVSIKPSRVEELVTI